MPLKGLLIGRYSEEVANALAEAADCVKFLRPLRPLIERFVDAADFASLAETFGPLMQTMLLVWTHSKHFNTHAKLLALTRRLANVLITHARTYLPGESLLRPPFLGIAQF